MRVLVDADYLAYSCGFASQRVAYDYTVVLDGNAIAEGITSFRDEVSAVEAMMPAGAELVVSTVVEAEPLVNALAMTKRTLLNVEEAMDQAGLEFSRLELYLTGKGNFRDSIATIRGYKANRIGFEKPVHYKAIRRYMLERWNAYLVHGIEADDAVAMAAADERYDPDRVCIVSVDKDLLTVPGRLFNFKRKTMRVVTPHEAMRAFYRQLVTGDVVDNIVGCYKSGEKKALALVDDGAQDELAVYTAVLEEYRASTTRKGCPYVDGDAALLENARLLHLQRAPGQMWESPVNRDPMLYWMPAP